MTTIFDEQHRPEPPLGEDEWSTLNGFLDFHRATLAWKVSGLTADDLAKTLPPSTMTLGGLVKHLTYVEDDWFDDVSQRLELELKPSAQWVSEYYPVIARDEQEGHICVTFPMASQRWASALLLRLGAEVLRVSDDHVARAAASDACKALEHYSEPPA